MAVCSEVSEKVFSAVMKALFDQKLLIEGLMLKPNMVTPGAQSSITATPGEIAFETVKTLGRTIVPALPTICFLSGGQSEENASLNLSAMNAMEGVAKPWSLTFSYGRALQGSVLKAWGGDSKNVAAAQKQLLDNCRRNGDASLGKYKGGEGTDESLF
jgi:fructose-bisphosphate aldolase class I